MLHLYQCHDCGHEFERPGEEEPRCPSCSSRSVTFEGNVTPSAYQQAYEYVRPLINYTCFPWLFFKDRGIPRSVGLTMIMVLFLGMFMAYYQGRQAGDISYSVGEPGSIYILRAPDVILKGSFNLLEPNQSTRSHKRRGQNSSDEKDRDKSVMAKIGWLYGLGLAMEIYWASILIIILAWDKFEAMKQRVGAVMAGSVWIPNLLLAFSQIMYFRLIQYDIIGNYLSEMYVLEYFHYGLATWLLYVLVGGLWSLDLSFFSYLVRLILALFLQVFGIFTILNVVKVYLFPMVDLPGSVMGGQLILEAIRYCGWPFSNIVL